MALIEASSISKTYAQTKAVDQINFAVEAGEIYGLVGSDGAGKTTTLRLLVGALRPDSGSITICGYDVLHQTEQARSVIGYLSQRFSLYEDLTVLENIRFFAEVRGLPANQWKPRCLELLDFVGLGGFSQRKAGALSGGMKQKLGLASALVSRPKVLLLDEPTTGVDPVTRQDFWQLIIRIVKEAGIAVMLTTPYMDEAVRCNRLGFMRAGRIIAEGTPSQLTSTLEGRILEVSCTNPIQLRSAALEIEGVEDARPFGDRLHIRTEAGMAPRVISAIGQWVKNGTSQQAARSIPATLEDVFLAFTTHGEKES
jgi:ABC-2 type transport system ATP-binding protein